MFVFTKFIALTSAFCIGVALLMDVGLIVAAKITGGVGIFFSRWNWLALWTAVWLASFFLTWRILVTPWLARIPKG